MTPSTTLLSIGTSTRDSPTGGSSGYLASVSAPYGNSTEFSSSTAPFATGTSRSSSTLAGSAYSSSSADAPASASYTAPAYSFTYSSLSRSLLSTGALSTRGSPLGGTGVSSSATPIATSFSLAPYANGTSLAGSSDSITESTVTSDFYTDSVISLSETVIPIVTTEILTETLTEGFSTVEPRGSSTISTSVTSVPAVATITVTVSVIPLPKTSSTSSLLPTPSCYASRSVSPMIRSLLT